MELRKENLNLTPKEIEVLKLIVKGLNNNEIAEKLVLSLSTVKFHIENIFTKLNTDNRTRAAVIAVKMGIE